MFENFISNFQSNPQKQKEKKRGKERRVRIVIDSEFRGCFQRIDEILGRGEK